MMIRLWRLVRHFAVLLLALTAVVSSDLSSQGRRPRGSVMVDGREAVDGEVLVRFRNAAATFEHARAAADVDADEVEPVGRRGTRRMRARRLGTHELLARLRANPDVDFVEPNYIVRLVATPNDPSFGNLWGLFNFGQTFNSVPGADIDAGLAWDLTTGTRTNVVGIIDSGVDYNHPDLAANMWTAPAPFSVTLGGVVINCAAGTHGFNAITNICDPMDDNSHGTHVAGTIGAVGNNGIGVAGVNWTASMMGLKFLNSAGSGSTSNAIKAIEFAAQAKAIFGAAANVRVLSNSWGGGGYSQSLLDEINRANSSDILFVAAAGNSGENADLSPMYPAAYSAPNIISVAATDNRDQRASFSNYGAMTVHLGAPGVDILSTTPNNSYSTYSGTSMATPHVSGAAALVLSTCPMTTATLKAALLNSVDPIAALSGVTTSGGRLNVNAALRTCAPPSLTVNGQAGAVTAVTGTALTVRVSNGPGLPGDWVTMVPAGSPPTYWSNNYQYMNGSTNMPAVAMSNATLTFTAPSPGSYELRLFENGGWVLRASSGPVTVNNPVPAITALSPASVAAGGPALTLTLTGSGFISSSEVRVNGMARATTFVSSTTLSVPITAADRASAGVFAIAVSNPGPGGGSSSNAAFSVVAPAALTVNGVSGPVAASGGSAIAVGVSNGPGNRADFVMMVAAGSAPTYWTGNYQYLSGSTARPAVGMTSATLLFTAPSAGGSFEFRLFENDTWILRATSSIVTVGPGNPVPAVAALSPPSVTAGAAPFTLTVTGSGFVPASQVRINGSARATTYVSATTLTTAVAASDVIAAGTLAVSVSSPAPGGGTSGVLNFAVTAPVVSTSQLTVNGGTSPVTVTGGSLITLRVVNGPGMRGDFVTMVPVGSTPNYWSGNYQYLSGTTTRPVAGMTDATLTFVAPASGGPFEFRLFENDTWTLRATSSAVTVTAGNSAPALTVNGAATPVIVAAGSMVTVGVTNGPGFRSDYVMLVPAGAPANYWSGTYQYLSGSTTRPASGMTAATLTFVMPAAGGPYELRLFENDTWTLRATSPVVTVSAGNPSSGPALAVNGVSTPVTVTAGSLVTVGLTNGPGLRSDYVMLVPAGSAPNYWSGNYQYLSGTTTRPSAGMPNATLTFTAPASSGTFELRLFENDTWTLRATSSVITVVP